MNVGQILETNLGWAAYELRKAIKKMAGDKNADKLRKFLGKLYSSEKYGLTPIAEAMLFLLLSCKV